MTFVRLAPKLRHLCSSSTAATRAFSVTARAAQEEQWPQRTPLGPYYESMIQTPAPAPVSDKPPSSADPEVLPPDDKSQPTSAPRPTKKKPGRKPKTESSSAANPTPSGSPATSPPVPPSSRMTPEERARRVFGSREASMKAEVERRRTQGTYLAGVLVPPRPDEPDNCCMSGCVNCVWDLYRDEIEEWSAKKNEAQARMATAAGTGAKEDMSPEVKMGMQVGEAKITKDLWDDDAFQNVPVGIREFMKVEKKLRDMHKQEGTAES